MFYLYLRVNQISAFLILIQENWWPFQACVRAWKHMFEIYVLLHSYVNIFYLACPHLTFVYTWVLTTPCFYTYMWNHIMCDLCVFISIFCTLPCLLSYLNNFRQLRFLRIIKRVQIDYWSAYTKIQFTRLT